jgi:hypothetical protein
MSRQTDTFLEWASRYENQLASMTGTAIDTLAGDGDPAASDEYWNELWQKFLKGADPITLANEDAKGWRG